MIQRCAFYRKSFLFLVSCLLGFTTLSGFGQSQVAITLRPATTGPKIAPDFLGLSFEMQRVLADTNGYHFFSPTNSALIATFKTLGIQNLRVGGNTADRPTLPVPSRDDIDSLFGFAKAAGVKVIYTLRLNHGDPDADADTVKYIRRHYSRQLDCFSIGNEPNVYSTNFASFFAEWKRFATRISARSWGVKFSGPGVSPGHQSWTAELADQHGRSPLVLSTQHDYPGGDARKVKDPAAARDKILSPAIDEHYSKFANDFVPAVFSNRLPYRLEEANSYYDGGAADVSDTYASALWALDYLWWWAQHGASGVNFHTGDSVAAREENKPCRYATFWTSPQGYNIHPIGYAEKMFSLGAEGRMMPVTMTNLDDVNLAVYAAASSRKKMSITLINREYAPNGRTVDFTIDAGLKDGTARVIFLSCPGSDVSSKILVSIGGDPIGDNAEWNGKWMPVTRTLQNRFALHLLPATAAVVEITAK